MIALAPSSATYNYPLSEDDFDRLMEACGSLPAKPHVAVAVSGGPDSTALLFLLHRWLQKQDGTLLALSIDHRLRENSGDELRDLSARLEAHSIPHVVLPWSHTEPPQSAVHAEARKARYDLLLNACRDYGIAHLFLGHHADDQAETMLMRLSKSTGIDGLAGMSLAREQDGVTLLRPLLPVRKAQLEATCQDNGWEFIRDPTNESERFSRARLRTMQQGLAQAGFTVERLLDVARDAGAARAQLEAACNEWLQAHASLNIYGAATLEQDAWKKLDHPMRLRVLNRVLMCVGGGDYPQRGASLERLAAQLCSGPANQTLGGCQIEAQFKTISVTREYGVIDDTLPLNDAAPYRRWDNRFVFSTLPRWDSSDITIRALKNISRKALVAKGADSVAALPLAIRAGLPGLFIEDELLGVPHFVSEAPDLPRQALVTARFSPRAGFLVKPFRPSSFMLT